MSKSYAPIHPKPLKTSPIGDDWTWAPAFETDDCDFGPVYVRGAEPDAKTAKVAWCDARSRWFTVDVELRRVTRGKNHAKRLDKSGSQGRAAGAGAPAVCR